MVDGKISRKQVLEPFINPREHGLTDRNELVKQFRSYPDYAELYKESFGRSLNQAEPNDIALALSSFVSYLKPKSTPLERYLKNYDKTALNPQEQQGMELFRGRAGCAECHRLSPLNTTLTDGGYHARGIDMNSVSANLSALIRTLTLLPKEERELQIGLNSNIAALGSFRIDFTTGGYRKI